MWHILVVQPLTDGLIYLYQLLGSWGLAIIAFTLIVKVLVYPLTLKQLHSAKAMQELQPKMQELQKKHGKDREKLMQEQMQLYKEHKVNPASGCLPLLVQMPIWFGLYQALINLSHTPEFASRFLWLPSLAHPDPWYILPVLTGLSQWVTQKMMTPRSTSTTDPTQKSMTQAMQFMPIMFAIFALSVPSGLALYWVTTNVFSFVQQYFATGWGSLFPEPQESPKIVSRPTAKPEEPLSLLSREANPAPQVKSIPKGQPPSSAGERTQPSRRKRRRR